MPCDSGPSPDDLLRTRLDDATRVACELMQLLAQEQLAKVSRFAAQWIAEHRRLDQEREAKALRALEREAVKRQAMNKLTLAEREALGIR